MTNIIDRKTVTKICWQLDLDNRLGKHLFQKIHHWNQDTNVKERKQAEAELGQAQV